MADSTEVYVPVEVENQDEPGLPADLDSCPRCGTEIPEIVWGQTNCPVCGLHFECC